MERRRKNIPFDSGLAQEHDTLTCLDVSVDASINQSDSDFNVGFNLLLLNQGYAISKLSADHLLSSAKRTWHAHGRQYTKELEERDAG